MRNQRKNSWRPKQKEPPIPDIPNEIILIILSKLPVKSLLRFKCVCNLWDSWISNPKFKLSNQQRGGAFVLSRYKGGSTYRIVDQQLCFDFKISKLRYNVLGSCDGLLLINVREHIFLWNPVTRFCNKVLEHNILASDNMWHVTGGLCFDSFKNDYKVMLVTRTESPDNFGSETAIIASLKDKKWRGVHCSYDMVSLSVPDWITMHGRLHSRVRVSYLHRGGGPHNRLIYFDAVSEKFYMFPIPEHEDIAIVGLGVLNECLCMMTFLDYSEDLELWIMKEYGVKESWTSLFVMRNVEYGVNKSWTSIIVNLRITRSNGLAQPLFMTENGEIVLLIVHSRERKIVVYNPNYDSARDFFVPSSSECIEAITYSESLTSPEGYYWNEYIHK